MDIQVSQKEQIPASCFSYHDGRLYFTRQFERRIFFIGTVIMMAWGLLDKFGVL